MRTLLILSVAACAAERAPQLDRERVLLGPIPLKRQLAWVDSALDRVIAIDVPDGSAPRVLTWRIGRRPIFAAPTPAGDHLLVITRGAEALERGRVDEPPRLWSVDLTDPDAEPVAYAIGSPFDRLAIAADSSLAVAHFSASGPDGEGFFRNPNELAFVDLTRPPDDANPTSKTIRSFGAAPIGLALSPRMTVPGAADATPRIFAFVLAANAATIVGASHPASDEVSIRLDAAGANPVPRELVFAPDTATAYVRSDGARDVLEIALVGDAPGSNDYRPILAELGAGAAPSDIAVFDDPDGRRFILATAPARRELVIIDAATAQFRTVATPDPIDRIAVFGTTAVLAQLVAGAPRIHAIELARVHDPLARLDLRTVQLARPVRDLAPVPGRALALLVHDDARTVLGLLDVAAGTVAPLEGVGRLDSFAFTPAGETLAGTTTAVPRVGLLDLSNLHPTDVRLDYLPRAVYALATGALIVDHGDPFGRATVIPDPASGREAATVLSGFLLADLLDEEAP
jgi:hypothetical protein